MILHRSCFTCATYEKYGKSAFTAHYISERQLQSIVLEGMRAVASGVAVAEIHLYSKKRKQGVKSESTRLI